MPIGGDFSSLSQSDPNFPDPSVPLNQNASKSVDQPAKSLASDPFTKMSTEEQVNTLVAMNNFEDRLASLMKMGHDKNPMEALKEQLEVLNQAGSNISDEDYDQLMSALNKNAADRSIKSIDSNTATSVERVNVQEIDNKELEQEKKDKEKVKVGLVVIAKEHTEVTKNESDAYLVEVAKEASSKEQEKEDVASIKTKAQENQAKAHDANFAYTIASDKAELAAKINLNKTNEVSSSPSENQDVDENTPLEKLSPAQFEKRANKEGFTGVKHSMVNGQHQFKKCSAAEADTFIGLISGKVYAKAGSALDKIITNLSDPKKIQDFLSNIDVVDEHGNKMDVKLSKAGPAVAAEHFSRIAQLCVIHEVCRAAKEARAKRIADEKEVNASKLNGKETEIERELKMSQAKAKQDLATAIERGNDLLRLRARITVLAEIRKALAQSKALDKKEKEEVVKELDKVISDFQELAEFENAKLSNKKDIREEELQKTSQGQFKEIRQLIRTVDKIMVIILTLSTNLNEISTKEENSLADNSERFKKMDINGDISQLKRLSNLFKQKNMAGI